MQKMMYKMYIIAGMSNMTLPKDPVMLLSLINTKLRDFNSSLDDFCKENDLNELMFDVMEALIEAGFLSRRVNVKEMRKQQEEIYKKVQTEDLLKYGLIPEFVGRLPIVASLDPLDESALVKILKEPKNSLVKQFKKLFELDNVELEIDDDVLIEVARKAIERKTGARGLRSILEETMMDVMYDIPSRDDVSAILINKDCIIKKSEPLIRVKDTKKGA